LAAGQRLAEGIGINKGLFALGNMINALADGNHKLMPWRDSKLTKVLKVRGRSWPEAWRRRAGARVHPPGALAAWLRCAPAWCVRQPSQGLPSRAHAQARTGGGGGAPQQGGPLAGKLVQHIGATHWCNRWYDERYNWYNHCNQSGAARHHA
jgi:hypothetical protein